MPVSWQPGSWDKTTGYDDYSFLQNSIALESVSVTIHHFTLGTTLVSSVYLSSNHFPLKQFKMLLASLLLRFTCAMSL